MSDWETYWRDIHLGESESVVFWDSENEAAFFEDQERFKLYLKPGIPLLDVGCGHGRQARFFAQSFGRVLGLDISPTAIKLARQESADFPNLDYRVFDGVDTNQACQLHNEFGDMNVYMRGYSI